MQTSRALPTHPIVLIDDHLDLYSQAGSSMSSPLSFNMPYLHIPYFGGDSDLYSQAGSSVLPPLSQIV